MARHYLTTIYLSYAGSDRSNNRNQIAIVAWRFIASGLGSIH
ncbi:MAG: hypothetical protein V7K35_23390 [Nostoc sp.]